MSLASEAEVESRLLEMQAALDRAHRKLADKESKHAEYMGAIYQAARDEFKRLKLPPVKPPKVDRRTKAAEIACPLVSDLQLAKITSSYNSEVAEERMYRYADKIIELTEVQRSDHPVKEVVVPVLGDMVEGLMIFPGQAYLVDSSLYTQVAVDGPRIVRTFLARLLAYFDKVTVLWIIGNHGRVGRRGEFDPETNMDRVLGKVCEMLFENEPRIEWVVPDGQHSTSFYYIARKELGNYQPLLLHGYQFRGGSFGGLPYYGFKRKVDGWGAGGMRSVREGGPFSDVFSGHYHQTACIPIGIRKIWQNGTFESDNEYAEEELASMSDPQQWTLFVNPEKGRVTSSYIVDLL